MSATEYKSDELNAKSAELLTEHGLTIATAESCTGGLLSKTLTDLPGASKYFMGGVVAYAPSSKIEILSVDPMLIQNKGVVCREVALAMADGARNRFNADIGVGITGVAGPGADPSDSRADSQHLDDDFSNSHSDPPDSGDKLFDPPVGTIFVALTTKEISRCDELHLSSDRGGNRAEAASHALRMLIAMID